MIRSTSPPRYVEVADASEARQRLSRINESRYPINPLDANPGVYFCGLLIGHLHFGLPICEGRGFIPGLPPFKQLTNSLFVSCLRSQFDLVSSLPIPFRKWLLTKIPSLLSLSVSRLPKFSTLSLGKPLTNKLLQPSVLLFRKPLTKLSAWRSEDAQLSTFYQQGLSHVVKSPLLIGFNSRQPVSPITALRLSSAQEADLAIS
jgi:hypothetical protein